MCGCSGATRIRLRIRLGMVLATAPDVTTARDRVRTASNALERLRQSLTEQHLPPDREDRPSALPISIAIGVGVVVLAIVRITKLRGGDDLTPDQLVARGRRPELTLQRGNWRFRRIPPAPARAGRRRRKCLQRKEIGGRQRRPLRRW